MNKKHKALFLFFTKWLELLLFNATFNNISVVLWWSVLLVEETRVSRYINYLLQVRQTLSLYWEHIAMSRNQTLVVIGTDYIGRCKQTLVVIGTDYIGRCKSNYHMVLFSICFLHTYHFPKILTTFINSFRHGE